MKKIRWNCTQSLLWKEEIRHPPPNLQGMCNLCRGPHEETEVHIKYNFSNMLYQRSMHAAMNAAPMNIVPIAITYPKNALKSLRTVPYRYQQEPAP